MTRRRTVTCSYCGQKGHNKAGCPKFKAKLAAREKAHPNCAWLANEKYNEAQRKKRACTYCGEEGHNRTTCKAMKQDILLLEQKNQAWKVHVCQRLKDTGLLPGALFTEEGRRWNKEARSYETEGTVTILYIVLGFDVRNFNIVEKDLEVLVVCEPRYIGQPDMYKKVSLPRDIRTGRTFRYVGRGFEVVSPVDPSKVDKSFDHSIGRDWLHFGTSWTDKYFKKSLHKNLNKWCVGYELYSRKSKYTGKFDNQPHHFYWSDETHV